MTWSGDLQEEQALETPERGSLADRVPSGRPTQVWMDLAEKITGPLEEALTVAFSQVQPSDRQDGVFPTGLNKGDLAPGPFLLLAL